MNVKYKLSALLGLSLAMIVLGGCMGGGGGSAQTEYGTFTVTATGTVIQTKTDTATLTDTSTVTNTTTVTQSGSTTSSTGSWGVADPVVSTNSQK
jgi:carbohydrate-binding DOMON domain-containing protein